MSRELLQQALDALDDGSQFGAYQILVDALRSALAQPEAEPIDGFGGNLDAAFDAPGAKCDGGTCGLGGYCSKCPKQMTTPAVPAVPVSWDRLRTLMDGIPTREEFIGGQRQQYVAKEAVMGWLYEGQLRAEREAALSALPAVQPLTVRELQLIDGMIDVQLHHAAQCDGIANRTMAEKQKGWDMERVELLRKLRAHGIAAPGSADHD